MASTNDVELASMNDVGLASSHADIKRLEDQFRQYRDESQKEIQRLKEDVKKLKEKEQFATSSYTTLRCGGRICIKCGECRDWYFTGDAETWEWIRSYRNWTAEDNTFWGGDSLYQCFTRRDGATCRDDIPLHLPRRDDVPLHLPRSYHYDGHRPRDRCNGYRPRGRYNGYRPHGSYDPPGNLFVDYRYDPSHNLFVAYYYDPSGNLFADYRYNPFGNLFVDYRYNVPRDLPDDDRIDRRLDRIDRRLDRFDFHLPRALPGDDLTDSHLSREDRIDRLDDRIDRLDRLLGIGLMCLCEDNTGA